MNIDVKNELIRDYNITSASVHDSNVFEELLDYHNTSRAVWVDSAYRSGEKLKFLKEHGFREYLQRKGCHNKKKLTEQKKQRNWTRSKVRSRIKHILGVQAYKAGNLILRTIGIARAQAEIGLRNLAYNMDRYLMLTTA